MVNRIKSVLRNAQVLHKCSHLFCIFTLGFLPEAGMLQISHFLSLALLMRNFKFKRSHFKLQLILEDQNLQWASLNVFCKHLERKGIFRSWKAILGYIFKITFVEYHTLSNYKNLQLAKNQYNREIRSKFQKIKNASC